MICFGVNLKLLVVGFVPIVAIECERFFKSFLLQNAHDSYVIKLCANT